MYSSLGIVLQKDAPVPNTPGSHDPQCTRNRGVSTIVYELLGSCIQHWGVMTPKCIHNQGVPSLSLPLSFPLSLTIVPPSITPLISSSILLSMPLSIYHSVHLRMPEDWTMIGQLHIPERAHEKNLKYLTTNKSVTRCDRELKFLAWNAPF